MIARLRSDPIPLRKVRGDLQFSEAVEEVLRKAMQRNPDDRYQTALEYADALTRAAAASYGTPR
jgi:serine/threonine protein kinase